MRVAFDASGLATRLAHRWLGLSTAWWDDGFVPTIEPAPETVPAVFCDDEAIKRYVDILTRRGIEWGLLGPREPERIWERHIFNCAALSQVVPKGVTVRDIGSGAGLPGLVLAIQRPDLQVELVESLLRRSEFLQLAVDELALGDRVSVVRARAEELSTVPDVITCRAVAPLDKLVAWCDPALRGGAQLMALKGERAQSELEATRGLLGRRGLIGEVRSVRAHQLSEPTQVVIVERG